VREIFRILMLFPGLPRTKAGRTVHPPSWLADYETNAIAKHDIKWQMQRTGIMKPLRATRKSSIL
jgi:hypothetical protein